MAPQQSIEDRLASVPDIPSADSLRLFVYAMPGAGKTTFVGSISNSVLIDVEGEAGFLLQPRAKIIIPRDGQDLEEILDWLVRKGPSGTGFARVSIDTIDAVYRMAIPWTTTCLNKELKAGNRPEVRDIREWKLEGAGFARLNEWILAKIVGLRIAGYGICISSHLREHQENAKSKGGMTTRMVLRPIVPDGIKGPLFQFSQFAGQIYRTQKYKQGNDGRLKAVPVYEFNMTPSSEGARPDTLSKARFVPFMQDKQQQIVVDVTGPDGWENVVSLYQEACEKAEEVKASQAQVSTEKESTQ